MLFRDCCKKQHVIIFSLLVWFFLLCNSRLPALVYTWKAGKEMVVWVCEIFHVQLGKWPITGLFVWIKYVTGKHQGAEVKYCCGNPHYLSLTLYGGCLGSRCSVLHGSVKEWRCVNVLFRVFQPEISALSLSSGWVLNSLLSQRRQLHIHCLLTPG